MPTFTDFWLKANGLYSLTIIKSEGLKKMEAGHWKRATFQTLLKQHNTDEQNKDSD